MCPQIGRSKRQADLRGADGFEMIGPGQDRQFNTARRRDVRYLVVVDRGSTIGRVYAQGTNDGWVTSGDEKHPVLDCTEIDPDGPYLFVKRDMTRHGGKYQTIYIPHGFVAFILVYADEGPKPIGFTPLPGAPNPTSVRHP
jgi:hypothetical protein